jgi:Kef-type K+ transport system membrane component KefB
MTTVGIILAAAAVALGLAMRTRIPTSVLAILAGVVMQVLSVPVEGGIVRDGLLIASTFLVFAVGGEIERKPLRAYRRLARGLGSMTLIVTAAVGALLWAVLGLSAWTAVYWVTTLSASSTLLVFELLRSRQQLFEPTGRLVSATALMQDLMVILTLSVFVALAPTTPHPGGVLAGVAGLAVAGWLLSRWVGPFVLERLKLDEEERLLFILLVLFGFAAIARWTGGALVTGAYFAGLAISRFPVGDLARGYLKSFSDFFTTVFYVTLGLLITVPGPGEVVTELVFVAAIVLVRPLLLLPVVRRSGLTVRSSIETVTLLAQAGELAVVVAIVGVELGHLDEAMLGAVVAVVAVTMGIVPWLSSDRVTWRLTGWYPSRRKASFDKAPTDHVLLLGCGETGSRVLAGLRPASSNVVVVEGDPAVVQSLARQGVHVLRGDAADPKILREAQADRAIAIISTMRRAEDNARLLSTVRGPAVFVRVFSEQEAAGVRELGGHPVVEAELAAEALLSWHAALSEKTAAETGR